MEAWEVFPLWYVQYTILHLMGRKGGKLLILKPGHSRRKEKFLPRKKVQNDRGGKGDRDCQKHKKEKREKKEREKRSNNWTELE